MIIFKPAPGDAQEDRLYAQTGEGSRGGIKIDKCLHVVTVHCTHGVVGARAQQ